MLPQAAAVVTREQFDSVKLAPTAPFAPWTSERCNGFIYHQVPCQLPGPMSQLVSVRLDSFEHGAREGFPAVAQPLLNRLRLNWESPLHSRVCQASMWLTTQMRPDADATRLPVMLCW
ncbi:MAG: hypothetical protein CYG59_01835 [Chloroflexi bacterium]|nr:MAG: hypothetical protein CYG59_01835 [Chloroflexota bacterium]